MPHLDSSLTRTIALAESRTVEACLDLPSGDRFNGLRPLVFMVPSSRMIDLQGNGPQIGIRDSYLLLSRSLVQAGYATYRFAWSEPGKISRREALLHYRAARLESGVDLRKIFLLGMEDGADLLAREYYEFYAVAPPMGHVLLSPRVHPIDLNNLTCPYLVLHGQDDPQFQVIPYRQLEGAIHHHRARYGDLTANHWFPHLKQNLGRVYLAEEVVGEIQRWLKQVIKDPSRPQEPAARGSAA